MKQLLFFAFICFSVVVIRAQKTVSISLEKALEEVQKANVQLKISALEANAAKADYGMSSATFLPNISISHTGITTTNPLMAFGSKLNQEVLTAADFNPDLLNDPDAIENFATVISVQQPLFNADGFLKRKAAKSTFEAKELQFQRTQDYMQFETEKAYMQLQLAHKMVAVLQKANTTARANKKLTKDYYDQGLIQKADWLQAQVRASQVNDQLQQALSNLSNASDYLKFLMQATIEGNLEPYTDLRPTVLETLTTDTTLDNRADVKAMRKAAEAYKANAKADKLAFLPRLNAFGTYELYDDEVFKAGANGYTLGASLSWDIFKGSQRFSQAKKGKINADKAQLELQSYKAKSNMELDKAKRMLAVAKSQLVSSALALEQSEEALKIRTNRFKEGLEKTIDLLMAETQLAEQQLTHYQTIYEHNYALAYFKFLTKE